jgi:formylmethanofuran dehydrogenase subunit E
MMIRSYSYEQYLRRVEEFHGYMAPGVIIGGFMVDEAYQHLPPEGLYDAISETPKCLPDAIQLLTPCTVGNSWLTIINLGRFALALYDKQSGHGVRVCIDTAKLDSWPEIKSWFLKLTPKKEQDDERLLREIADARADITSTMNVTVTPHILNRQRRGKIAICPSCNEAYPQADGSLCSACGRDAIYEFRRT